MGFVDDNMINLDEGTESHLREIKDIVLENNKMLHSMRRTARFGMILHSVYWIIIIGASIGAFIYIQPYIDEIMKTYTNIQQTSQKASDFSQNFNLNSIKEYFGGSASTK